MFLVERRMSPFWIMRGQRRKSTSLQSLPGLGLESPHSLTIGFEGWLLNTIAPRSLSLPGPFTDRAVVEVLPQQMNFLMPLSLGLAIQIRGSERRGRRAKDWPSSLLIVEPYLFWMALSRSKIRLVHKKDGYGSLPSRRFCANSLPLIVGFAWLPRGRRLLISQITSAPQPFVVTWNSYPVMPVQTFSERWALTGMRRSYELPARSSLATVSL